MSSVAEIDEVPIVPGRMRIFLKSAANIGTHTFKVVASNSIMDNYQENVISEVVTI